MSKRALIHRLRPSVLRTRSAVAAAGIGAVMVVGAGAGVASASAGQAPVADPATVVAAEAVAKAKPAAKVKPAKKAVAWVKPVSGYTLTASFNQGGAMWSQKHSGQDFAVPVGTTVKAAGAGTVVKAGPNGGGDGPAYGNAIVIKHANGKYSQYAHLSQVNVGIGSTVKAGQTIAKSGNTGNSSGPHLHFEIRTTPNYGSALNPMSFLRTVGVSI
ncbi:M23 family metallopeptidase [Streptomyces sp. NBC_01142]|uniref:M23 family metallopeptidase n=1 Tax=Streptomyces sp. NBC_01142 TaxID=2975865 RepID=UPI002254E3A0|nr:M23 family metallopeptidase [Streptomyces sp. NBC_01142]MCX4818479.1 M23 family metallopeptidase [Streptomyces sp. NBC_01142]